MEQPDVPLEDALVRIGAEGDVVARRGGWPARQQRADTKRTHQKRQRDVSRRILTPVERPICRKNGAASDRACTRVTLPNLHGKEGVDGSSPSEGFAISLLISSFRRSP